jgi:hypothetical protein
VIARTVASWGDQYLALIKQARDFGVDEKMSLIAPIGVPEWMLYEPGVAAALKNWTFPTQWGGIWTYESNWPLLKKYRVERRRWQQHYEGNFSGSAKAS